MRETAGLSMTKLGQMIGVSRITIHHIEGGRNNPSFDTLKKWTKACGYEIAFWPSGYDALTPEKQEVLRMFTAALPHLSPREVRSYRAELSFLFEELGEKLNES